MSDLKVTAGMLSAYPLLIEERRRTSTSIIFVLYIFSLFSIYGVGNDLRGRSSDTEVMVL